MKNLQDNWCYKEFCSINLGDFRLNQRFLKVSQDLLNRPTEAISTASTNWSNAKAAYRLFDNKRVKDSFILQPHQKETLKRLARSEGVVFAIQDTTTLTYTHHPKKKGIHKINQNPGFKTPTTGCFLHNTLLLTEKGLPLGLLDQKIFQHNLEKGAEHKRRPITEKESFRWIEALALTKSLCQDQEVVTLADRESDIFEFFVEAQKLDAKVLVRAAKNRRLLKDEVNLEGKTLWKYMEGLPSAGEQTLELLAAGQKKKRQVHLEIRYATITLKPPQRYPGAKVLELPAVQINAVWLYEPNPIEEKERLEWMLLTNVEVESIEQAIKMGRWYRQRWQIECYHRVLKSGCKIEDCRLESYERFKKYIHLKSILAYRLFWLTLINRTDPEKPSSEILEPSEWKSLCCYLSNIKDPPEKPPSTKEAIIMIAKLGGFLGRKSDKNPGMTTIWRGWERLTLLAEFWRSIHQENICG